MSTARTTIGCLAEDYPQELAEIIKAWLAQPGVEVGALHDEKLARLRDVGLSFVAEVEHQINHQRVGTGI